ncbi:MAG: helix-turn-helix transcriptional regulator [Myxococcales bacterium]|nr:helix-turn-helix transcriptional regulator [Myxococcales bacterium]
MRWNEIGDMTCSVARTLSVVGDRWTLMILRDCFLGTRRFDAFQRQLGATPHVLTDRLRKLVDEGVLVRVPYQQRPLRHEYRLTEKGLDLYPVIASLVRFGDRWLAGEAGAPLELHHRRCGQPSEPVLSCSACGDALDPREMEVRPGPALRALGLGGDAFSGEPEPTNGPRPKE